MMAVRHMPEKTFGQTIMRCREGFPWLVQIYQQQNCDIFGLFELYLSAKDQEAQLST